MLLRHAVRTFWCQGAKVTFMTATASGKRTGRPRSLHEPDIIAAALAEGLDSVSMPSVARRLGVTHSALYRYFPDRNALLIACIGTAIERTTWPDGSEPWRECLSRLADSMWEMFSAHKGLAETVMSVPGTAPQGVALVERLVEGLCRQGFSPHDATLAIDFVADLTISTFTGMARLDAPVEGGGTARDRYRQDWSQPEILAEVVSDDAVWYGRGWLDEKMSIFLDGLERRVSG